MTFKPALTKIDESSEIMCSANGCPNIWTVDNGLKLCNQHAWSDIQIWDEITKNLNIEKTSKIYPKFAKHTLRGVPDEARTYLESIRSTHKTPKDPKQWAYSLMEKERLGEPLTRLQKLMWRSVLKVEL